MVASIRPLKGSTGQGSFPMTSTWDGFTVIVPDTANPIAIPSNPYLSLFQLSRRLLISFAFGKRMQNNHVESCHFSSLLTQHS
jgi:hypothetical protein